MFTEEECLMISGIQHYYFCKRQWSLIHVEQQWAENVHTVRGDIFHDKVHNPTILESRKNIFISRSLPVISYKLGFYGIIDAVEFVKDPKGCYISAKKSNFRLYPVEYKVGKPKLNRCDAVQIGVQALCLEEMFQTEIKQGYLYYGKTRHREQIEISEDLRKEIQQVSIEMHQLMNGERDSDKPVFHTVCRNCSMYNICLPQLHKTYLSVNKYIQISISNGG